MVSAAWSRSVKATSSSPRFGKPHGAPQFAGRKQGHSGAGGHVAAPELAFTAKQLGFQIPGGLAFLHQQPLLKRCPIIGTTG